MRSEIRWTLTDLQKRRCWACPCCGTTVYLPEAIGQEVACIHTPYCVGCEKSIKPLVRMVPLGPKTEKEEGK